MFYSLSGRLHRCRRRRRLRGDKLMSNECIMKVVPEHHNDRYQADEEDEPPDMGWGASRADGPAEMKLRVQGNIMMIRMSNKPD